MRYRIVKSRQGYICQERATFLFFSYWSNMFCGAWSDLPTDFLTVEQAEDAIMKEHDRGTKEGVVVKEGTVEEWRKQ